MAASGITPKTPIAPVRPEPAGRDRPGRRQRRERPRTTADAPPDADDDEVSLPPRSRLDVLV